MIYITPEDGERILEDFTIHANKQNPSSDIANESLLFLNDIKSKKIILASLLIRHKDQMKELDNGRIEMRTTIIDTLRKSSDSLIMPDGLLDKFKECLKQHSANDSHKNKRMEFAVDQFVEAFYWFDEIEFKYPNLIKQLK